VRPASHARLSLDEVPSGHADIEIEYLRYKRLLARERRPLTVGSDSIWIKTHPRATHVRCSVSIAGQPPDGIRFSVSCGEPLEPVGKYFIVIGAMKSGTTTFFEMLSRHPAICRTWVEVPEVSFTKEINYFHKLYRKGHTPVHYDWRFPFDPARHAWTLDVSPNYAKLPRSRPVPRRIARLGGEIRLAYILREPVDRIESQIAHSIRHGGKVKSMGHCKRLSRYARHLDRFTAHIPRENILLLDFEQLCNDPDMLMATVCDFLAIDPIPGSARVHNRRSVDFRLSAAQRSEIAHALRPDVQRLISEYGFSQAEGWLRQPRTAWARLRKRKQ
jgi:hypothetical protein